MNDKETREENLLQEAKKRLSLSIILDYFKDPRRTRLFSHILIFIGIFSSIIGMVTFLLLVFSPSIENLSLHSSFIILCFGMSGICVIFKILNKKTQRSKLRQIFLLMFSTFIICSNVYMISIEGDFFLIFLLPLFISFLLLKPIWCLIDTIFLDASIIIIEFILERMPHFVSLGLLTVYGCFLWFIATMFDKSMLDAHDGKKKKKNDTAGELFENKVKEDKKRDQEIMQKEKMVMLEKLSSTISHELRNPLSIINNSIYYLKSRMNEGQDEKIKKHLELIYDALRKSKNIVNNLLDYVKLKRPHMKETEIQDILDLVFRNLEVPDNVIIGRKFNVKIPRIKLDSNLIEQVFFNMIQNAIDAMPDGGYLDLETDISENLIIIKIKDTGMGIPEDEQNHLFKPFYTTKENGVGLGLSIVKDIVEKHNGIIEVNSEKGTGTTFVIKLPLKKLMNDTEDFSYIKKDIKQVN